MEEEVFLMLEVEANERIFLSGIEIRFRSAISQCSGNSAWLI